MGLFSLKQLRIILCGALICLSCAKGAHGETEGAHGEAEMPSPFSVQEGGLLFRDTSGNTPLNHGVLDEGKLRIMKHSNISSFSLDVGFNIGQTTIIWNREQKGQSLFVIGIEANEHLVRDWETHEFTERLDGIFNDAVALAPYREKVMLIHGAATTHSGGVAKLNPGYGYKRGVELVGTGSLLKWRHKEKEKERLRHASKHLNVKTMRLSDILMYVPDPRFPNFVWDTLKLDVQGLDADALISAGDYVDRFMCVNGEFDSYHYQSEAEGEGREDSKYITDPASFLKQHQFRRVHWTEAPDCQIWLNARPEFISLYRKDPSRFGCDKVYDCRDSPQAMLKRFDEGGGEQVDYP